MTSTTCLTALVLLTVSSSLVASGDDTDLNVLKDHKESTDCQNTLECRTSSSNKPRRKNLRCQDDRDCARREVCHSFFKVCFSQPTQKSKLKVTGQTKTAPSCKTDRDCRQNQSCHVFFGTCLDNARVPATATTTSRPSVPTCKTNAECPKGQYCHDFFNICLPNLTMFFEPTSSTPRTGCTSDSDCENDGDFCHNLTRLCLPMPTNPTPTPPRKTSFSCNSHADCKMTEFCHFLIGMRNQDQSRGAQPHKHLKSALGVCIARALKDVPKDPSPVSLNCSHTADCGKGRCCLRDLGLCVGYRLPGQLCVAEDVSFAFSCPCLPGFTCVSRRRPMPLKRLERKLKLPQEAIEKLALQFHDKDATEFKVGKCQFISD